MQASDIPAYKFQDIWAIDASGADVTYPIPDAPGAAGRASLQQGFPPINFQPTTAGGIPPFGQDFNGAFQMVTGWEQWLQAGGAIPYDATFQAAIGGYPAGAILGTGALGSFWYNLTDNNTTDPDTGGAGWLDVIIGPLGTRDTASTDTGTANAGVVVFPQAISSVNSLRGYQISVQKVGSPNTGAYTLSINGFVGSVLHADGSALTNGELPGGGVFTAVGNGPGFTLQSVGYSVLSNNSNQSFTSGELGWFASQTISASHGLGTTPAFAWWKLVCLVAEQGYNVGDVIENSFSSVTLWVNATTIALTVSTGGIVAVNRSSFADVNLSPANWRVILFCRTII